MFQFSPFALTDLWIQSVVSVYYGGGVAPFGNLRIEGCLHLPGA